MDMKFGLRLAVTMFYTQFKVFRFCAPKFCETFCRSAVELRLLYFKSNIDN